MSKVIKKKIKNEAIKIIRNFDSIIINNIVSSIIE